jgi:putative ABC transport system ATP-binding protein
MAAMASPLVHVREVSMRLASGGRAVDVLTDISLDVPARQFLAIAGPSGSGKSTTAPPPAASPWPTSS